MRGKTFGGALYEMAGLLYELTLAVFSGRANG